MKSKMSLYIGLFVFVLAAYCIFFLIPLDQRNTTLESEYLSKQAIFEAKRASLEDKSTDFELNLEKENIRRRSASLFVNLRQEEALELMNQLASDLNLKFDVVEFAEFQSDDYKVGTIEMRLSFHSNYQDIMYLINRIKAHDKKIGIKSVSLELLKYPNLTETDLRESFFDSDILVNLILQFKYIPSLSDIGALGRSVFIGGYDRRNFPALFAQQDTQSTLGSLSNDSGLGDRNDLEEGEVIFFSNPEAEGQAAILEDIKNGGRSVEFRVDFHGFLGTGVYVFQGVKSVQGSPVAVSVRVYSCEFDDHEIGVLIRDANGEQREESLAQTVDWIGWKKLTVPFPKDIEFPCAVEGFYVRGASDGMRAYLFDEPVLEYAGK